MIQDRRNRWPNRGACRTRFGKSAILRVAAPALAVCLSALFAGPAAGADKFAAEFLKIGVGARPLGMGGAFVSLSDDASGAYWNPAGLAQLTEREVMLMHASQFGGALAHNFGSIALPLSGTSSPTTIGVSFLLLSVDDIRVTSDAKVGEDDEGNPEIDPGLIRTESAYDLGLLLTYARALGSRWKAGVNVKLVRQSLVDAGSSFGVGADLGVLFRPSETFAFGARLADITTTQLYWDSGRRETVAPTATLGGSAGFPVQALSGRILLALDVALAFENLPEDAAQFTAGSMSGDVRGGGEFWFRELVALRAGADAGNVTAGAGVRYKMIGVDYAYLDHELDATHRVSALVRF